MTTRRHPAEAIDVATASSRLAGSLDGSGPFWDPIALELRPDLHGDTTAGAETLSEIRKRLRDACIRRDGTRRRHGSPAHVDIALWCDMRAEEKREELLGIVPDADGMITLQRVLAAEPSGLRPSLGIFWSSDLAHGGILAAPWKTNGEPEMVLTARVHHSDVDWQTTCVARMDIYSGDYEKEIRLHPGRPLLDVRAGTWDQSLIPDRSKPIDLPGRVWTS